MPEMLDLKTEAGKTKIKDFTELVVWQKAHQLVLEVYRITRTFPEEERYGITSQMRRAAVSIAANVAEGFKRRGLKVKIQSYSISQGSLEEVKYYLILAKDLGYLKDNEKLLDLCDQGGRLLTALIISIRNA